MNAVGIAGFTLAGILFAALVALSVYVFLDKRKAKAAKANELETSKTVNEETAETDASEEKVENRSEDESKDNE